ncbi:hypothetical protein BS47DRAFT_1398501 [Hydnum rufescens UP504]|uniref:ATP-dependent DNA helicase n=1 Tax=Hydnum rufescens UP504 TaxID=1448309 RepID=A0A9P6AMM5_9AGAM|nr:hypothetical protein BS47DRAFT_1398501 [Hydnum rufescens UP504]
MAQSEVLSLPAIQLPDSWLREAKHWYEQACFLAIPTWITIFQQLEVIQAALERRDVFVLWPTGSGKSLCYQLPAVYESLQYGITVIISPLRTLILDQSLNLARTNVYVIRLSGDQSLEERQFMLNKLFQLTSCMLYVTPEMFFGRSCQDAISKLRIKKRLSRFVVDEAHCILEFGESFRKQYQRLSVLRQTYPDVPIMALTATANPKVMRETIKTLHIENCFVSRQPMDRSNLRYSVLWRAPGQGSIKSVFPIISRHQGQSGIVYCHGTATCTWLANKLKEQDIKAEGFHASLDPIDRRTRYDQWLRGELLVLVATVALGMGVDHPSVRFIIHWDVPKSLDAYIQETGRAGRDGLMAECVMMYMPRLWNGVLSNCVRSLSRDNSLSTAERSLAEKLAEKQIRCVNSYVMSNQCRHRYLLNYMGEEGAYHTCRPKACDTCIRPPHPIDMSVKARNLLRLLGSAIEKLQNPAGLLRIQYVTARKLANMYRGVTESDKAFSDLKLFGIGSKQNIALVDFFIAKLIELDILAEKLRLVHHGRDNGVIFTIEPGKHADDVIDLRQDVYIDFPPQVLRGGAQNKLVNWPVEEQTVELELSEENEEIMGDGDRESPEL